MTRTSDLGLQEKVMVVMTLLCQQEESESDELRAAFAEAGGIDAIMASMQAHEGEVDLQSIACHVLGALSFNVDNKEMIAKNGGVKAIIKGMQNHLTNTEMQHYGCWALASLAVNDDISATIGREGGVQAVVAAMGEHLQQKRVQVSGLDALMNLSFNADNKASIGQEGVQAVIAAAMEMYPSLEAKAQGLLTVSWLHGVKLDGQELEQDNSK
jgi:hypothetical protein